MGVLLFLLVSIGIGIEAQAWKSRTGAAWGFITLLVLIFLYVSFSYLIILAHFPSFQESSSAIRAVTHLYGVSALAAALSISFGSIGMAALVATLPNRKMTTEQGDGPLEPRVHMKRCPFCRTMIDARASICPQCRSRVPAIEPVGKLKFGEHGLSRDEIRAKRQAEKIIQCEIEREKKKAI